MEHIHHAIYICITLSVSAGQRGPRHSMALAAWQALRRELPQAHRQRYSGVPWTALTMDARDSSPASAMSCSPVRSPRQCGTGSPASGRPSASRSRRRFMQTSSLQTTNGAHGSLHLSWSVCGSASGCWSSHNLFWVEESLHAHRCPSFQQPNRQIKANHRRVSGPQHIL